MTPLHRRPQNFYKMPRQMRISFSLLSTSKLEMSASRLWAASSLTAMLLVGLISLFLGKDENWDLLNYHLYNAYSFLADRLDVDQHPAGIRSFFNPVLDILTYPLLTAVPDWLGGFILGAVQGIGLAFILAIGRELLGKSLRSFYLCLLCLVAAITGAMAWSEIGTTFADLTTAVPVLAALYFLLIALPQLDTRQGLGLCAASGLLVGIATALKLTNAGYALALLGGLALCAPRRRLLLLVCTGCAALLGLLVLEGWWALKLYRKYGNPLFPMFNAWWSSPYYPSINIPACINFPVGLLQTIFFPFFFSWNHQTEWTGHFRDFRFPAAYVSIVGLAVRQALRCRAKPLTLAAALEARQERLLITFVVVSYVAWQQLFSVQRYTVALEMLAPLLCVVFLKRVLPERLTPLVATMTLLALVVTTKPYDWGRSRWSGGPFFTTINLTDPPDGAAVILGTQPLAYLAPTMNLADAVWVHQSHDSVDRILGTLPFTDLDREVMKRKIHGRRLVLLSEVGRDRLIESRAALDSLGMRVSGFCSSFLTSVGGGRNYLLCPMTENRSAAVLTPSDQTSMVAPELTLEHSELDLRAGDVIWLKVTLRNAATSEFVANCADSLILTGNPKDNLPCGNANIAHRFLDSEGQPIGGETPPTRIPRSLAPGESISFQVKVKARREKGEYQIQFDIADIGDWGKILSRVPARSDRMKVRVK